jgi:hypothetical protein
MRRHWLLLSVTLLILATARGVTGGDAKETKSALDANPQGWTDLLAGGLKNWKRVPIPPGSKLSTRDPWSIDAATKMLICDGVGIHEMLLYDKEFADGIFHVEWRFKKIDGKKGYNSGVYARTSADGAVWHQAQVGSKNVGYLFGDTLVDGVKKRVKIEDKVSQRGKEAGEWNTYELTCKGKDMTLWINGGVTARWHDCQVPRGHVGLEAEGWYIEFKNLKFRNLDQPPRGGTQ